MSDEGNPHGFVRSQIKFGALDNATITQTHSGSGSNIVANNVTFQNTDRDINSAEMASFREKLLGLDKSLRYDIEHSMSDQEAGDFARQIGAFLDANGFNVRGYSSYMGGTSPKGQFVAGNMICVGRRG
jgi:hypothetical protein